MAVLDRNVGALCNETCKNLHQLYKLTVSLLFGLAKLHSYCSPLLSLVALHYADASSYHMQASLHGGTAPKTGPPWLYWPNVSVLLKCLRSTQM